MRFTVTSPAISTLCPATGTVATSVTITGSNFGATQGTSTVTFNGTAATPTRAGVRRASSRWCQRVLRRATSSSRWEGGRATARHFTVGSAGPSISTLSPTSTVGTTVAIRGANFGATQGTSTVKFNGPRRRPALVRDEHRGARADGCDDRQRRRARWGSGEQRLELHGDSTQHHQPVADIGRGGGGGNDHRVNFGATQGTSTVTFNGTAATTTGVGGPRHHRDGADGRDHGQRRRHGGRQCEQRCDPSR